MVSLVEPIAGSGVDIWAPALVVSRPADTFAVGPRGRESGGTRGDLTKLARGGALNFAGAVTNGLFGFVLTLLLTRNLVPGEAGVFFEAVALFSILSTTPELGADDGLVRMIPRFLAIGRVRDLRRTLAVALLPVLVIGSVFALAAWVFAPQLSHVFVRNGAHEEALVPYIRVLAVFIPINAVETAVFSATRGFGTMRPSALLDNMTKTILRPILAAGVLAAGLGAIALGLSYAAPIVLVGVLGFLWMRRLLSRSERRSRRAAKEGGQALLPRTAAGPIALEFWKFASPRALASLFGITVYWLDTLLLGALRNTAEAAIYTAASRYLYLGFFALGAIQLIIGPMISGFLSEGSVDRAKVVYQTATHWLVMAAWPVYVTLAVFAPFLLQIFKPAYVAGQHALLILSLAMMFSTLSGPVQVVLLMSGRSMWTLFNSMIGLGINVGLNLWLIPKYGMEGAALAWSASIVFNNLAGIIEVKALLKLSPFGPGSAIPMVASVVCFGGLGLLTRHVFGMTLGTFVVFGLVTTLVYGGLLYVFRRRLHLGILLQAVRARGGGRRMNAFG